MRIDLHCHSSVSDGTQPPADVIRRAHGAGVGVLGLTDHDTAAGWAEASAAVPDGMTLVPGAELSCQYETGQYEGGGLHMLAFRFDPADPELAAELDRLRTDRVRRGREIVLRLQELGAPVTWSAVEALAAGGAVGRPHIARAMVEAGVVPTMEAAFTSAWIAAGGRADVPRHALDPFKAVRLVAAAGGVTVLAHPRAARAGYDVADEVIEELAAAGLGGVEVDHPDQPAAERGHLRRLAGALGLAVTGGSDDHGVTTGHRLGCETTDPAAFERLMAG